MGVIAWLFNTKVGRMVLLIGTVAITTLLLWYLFADHYRDEGYEKCQAEHIAALNDANVDQAVENEERNDTASEIATEADEAGEGVLETINRDKNDDEREIRYVYRDRPTTAPVHAGSCVHPVDPRVQDRIDEAYRRAVDE